MQKEQKYHELFRARLPVASLSKEFADRLIKSVLDEVSQLRQARSLPLPQPDGHPGDSNPSNPSPLSKAQVTVKHPVILLFVWLLINLHVGLLLQGCTFYQRTTPWRFSPNLVSSTPIGKLPSPTSWQTRSHPSASTKLSADPVLPPAQVHHLPPLDPVKPTLPIVLFMQGMLIPQAKPMLTYTLRAVNRPPKGLPAAPAAVQQNGVIATGTVTGTATAIAIVMMPVTTPITLPYEQVATGQSPLPATAAAPIQTAMPTSDAPIVKSTVTSTPANSYTPVFSIFEPTMTPTPVAEEPVATPTLFIQPWHTPTSETVVPTVGVSE